MEFGSAYLIASYILKSDRFQEFGGRERHMTIGIINHEEGIGQKGRVGCASI